MDQYDEQLLKSWNNIKNVETNCSLWDKVRLLWENSKKRIFKVLWIILLILGLYLLYQAFFIESFLFGLLSIYWFVILVSWGWYMLDPKKFQLLKRIFPFSFCIGFILLLLWCFSAFQYTYWPVLKEYSGISLSIIIVFSFFVDSLVKDIDKPRDEKNIDNVFLKLLFLVIAFVFSILSLQFVLNDQCPKENLIQGTGSQKLSGEQLSRKEICDTLRSDSPLKEFIKNIK